MTTSQTYQADGDQMAPDHDQAVPEDNLIEPEASLAAPEPDLATAEPHLDEPEADPMAPGADQAAHDDLIIPDGDDRAAEPEMADSSPDSTALVSAAFTVPESVTDSHPAGNTARAAGPWNEVQAMFVDDPHASIERAAGLVDDRVEELIQSVRERQHSMQSAWQADDAGTEELRVALQHYRSFWTSLEDLPAPA